MAAYLFPSVHLTRTSSPTSFGLEEEDEADVAAEEEAALLALLLAVLPAVVAPPLPLLPPLLFFLLLPEEVEGRDLPPPTGRGCDRPALAPGKAVDDDVVNDFAWPVLPALALLPGPWRGGAGGGGGVTEELAAVAVAGLAWLRALRKLSAASGGASLSSACACA